MVIAPGQAHISHMTMTEFVDVNQVRIAFRTMGRGAPLLLLQRFRGNMDEWDPLFLEVLATRRRVICFDSAGVSLSSGRTPDTMAGMAQLAGAFLDALGLGEVDVLGWSMGGCVAQQLALDRPRSVRRLVLAATGPGGVADAPPTPDKVWQVAGKPVNDDEDFLYLFFEETPEGRAAGLAHLSRLRREAPRVGQESVMAQAAAIRAWGAGRGSALPRLSEIAHPTLVANGVHDVMIPAYNSFVMAQRLRNARLLLYPNAGHGFLFQYAEEFGDQVLSFLSR